MRLWWKFCFSAFHTVWYMAGWVFFVLIFFIFYSQDILITSYFCHTWFAITSNRHAIHKRRKPKYGPETVMSSMNLSSMSSVHDFHRFAIHHNGLSPVLHFHLAGSINPETGRCVIWSGERWVRPGGHDCSEAGKFCFVESSVAETWCKVCVWTAVRWESRQLLAIKERISQMMWMVASAFCSWSPFPSFFHSVLSQENHYMIVWNLWMFAIQMERVNIW